MPEEVSPPKPKMTLAEIKSVFDIVDEDKKDEKEEQVFRDIEEYSLAIDSADDSTMDSEFDETVEHEL